MRTIYSLLSPIAAVALSTAALNPAAAQTVASTEYTRPVIERVERTADVILRQLAVYRFARSHDVIMPSLVIVADSAGQLVATFRLAGSSAERPMMVEVLGSDLVLQGETPNGVLTLVMYDQNDARHADSIVGRWTLGTRQGELRGRVQQ